MIKDCNKSSILYNYKPIKSIKMNKRTFVAILALFVFILPAICQPISVMQYRHVPNDKINEFLYRETTYWSQVAQKAVDEGKLSQWILFQKIGGYDMPNSSNFLFINTVPDINMNMGEIWNPSQVFPDMPNHAMETNSISTVTAQVFARPMEWEEVDGANPREQFHYVKFNYWNTTSPNQFVTLEREHWGPFINAEMEKEATSQVAWGNAIILNPRGPEMPGNTISMDVYPTLKDMLIPTWSENAEFPEEGLNELSDLVTSRTEVMYRVVMAVTDRE